MRHRPATTLTVTTEQSSALRKEPDEKLAACLSSFGSSDCFVDMEYEQCAAEDVDALTMFLRDVDLTLSGLDAPSVRLWLARDEYREIVGSTGYELSTDGQHALIRSVAVHPSRRAKGRGRSLARFALDRAAVEGASTAWLFSRRSGPFWQSLGFESADRDQLAAALANTHQVQLFQQTGQLHNEVAWSLPLSSE